MSFFFFFFFQAEDGIRDFCLSRGLGDVYKRQILDCFLFELQDGTLSVTVSDSETTMVTTVEVNESDADGRFAVTAKTLLDALKEIPEQPLTFDINTSSLEITVQYQNGKYSLMGQNADEFPQSAMLGENAVRVEMDAQVLLGGINRAVFATADDELRPVMNGIYFDITTEDITMVASDGHKLVRCKTLAAKGNERAAFILPKKPANLMKNLLPKEQGTVTIEFDERNAVVLSLIHISEPTRQAEISYAVFCLKKKKNMKKRKKKSG